MMKRFTLRLILFCLLPLPLLYGLHYVVNTGLQKSRSYYYAEWNDIFSGQANADVLVCGSSRAYVHISPAILDSALQLNSYNIGLNGTQFMMQYDRFKIYLRHNRKPKYVIQTVDFASFAEKYELYAHQQFLPYLSDTDIQAMTIKYNGKFGIMEHYFPMFRYNNQMPLIKEGIKSFFNRGEKPVKYKGYAGQQPHWDETFRNDTGHPPISPFAIGVDKRSVACFYEFLELCRQQDIKVIIVFPPVYKDYLPVFKNRDEVLGIYASASRKYGALFWSYLDDELCYNKSLFYNSQHLDHRGAELLTRKVANRLKELIDSGKQTH